MDLHKYLSDAGGEIVFESYSYIKFSPHTQPIKVKSVFMKGEDCFYRDVDGKESLINEFTRTDINIKNSIIQKIKLIEYKKTKNECT